jgi:3'-5' exonuclease
MSILVFDIETIPDVNGLFKLDLIAKNSNDAANEYLIKRKAEKGSSFLPLHLQKIVAISCVLRRQNKQGQPEIFVNSLGGLDSNEEDLIAKFYKLIDKYQPQLVSWNGSGFDLPVLHYRSMIHNVPAYQYWDLGERREEYSSGYSSGSGNSKNYKYNNYINRYHLRHIDLMDLLALYQSKAYASMDDMAKLCNLPGKLGMDGSMVWDAYQNGLLADIRAYCETDVANTYLLYQRFNGVRYGEPALFEQEKQLLRDTVQNLLTTNPDDCHHWAQYLEKMI